MKQARVLISFTLLFLATLLTTACMTTNKSEESVNKQENIIINGTVSYRERMLPPPNSKLYVRLNNISLADAPSINIAEQVFDLSQHSVPVKYQFSIPKDSLKAKETYAVRAEIKGANGGLLWTTDTTYQIDSTKSSQSLTEMMMFAVKPVSTGDSILNLINIKWRVSDINKAGVIDNSQTSVMFSADGKLSGVAGCNQYSGDYKLHNGTLTIGPLAATKRACIPALNDQESKFFNVVSSIDGYSFNSEGALILKTADGKTMTAHHP